MTTIKYAGNGASKAFLSNVKGMIVLNQGTTITVATAKTLSGWVALISPATTAAIKGTFLDLARGLEGKSPAPEWTTANTGLKEKTMDFPPEFTGYGYMSWEDYQTWFASDAMEYDFLMVLENGDLMHAFASDGKVAGFRGNMFLTFDLPKPGGDGKQKACPFDVVLSDVDQIRNYAVLRTNFNRRELESVVPVGLKLEIVTDYESSGGTVVLKATHRVTGLPYAGFSAYTEFEVVGLTGDSGGAATAISATQAAVGIYTLTVLNTTPKMTSDFEIQGVKVSTGVITYLTNVLNIPV